MYFRSDRIAFAGLVQLDIRNFIHSHGVHLEDFTHPKRHDASMQHSRRIERTKAD